MTTSAAAQGNCPTRADLRQGIRLVADDPQHTRVFVETEFGLIERPVDAHGRQSSFAEIPSWLSVGGPHAILPGIIDGPKGKATILYYMEEFWSDEMEDGVQPLSHFLDNVLSGLAVGEKKTFGLSIDQGTWRFFGMAVWNQSAGFAEVTALDTSKASPRTIGQCSYDIRTYRVDINGGRGSLFAEDMHYAPALGLVVGRTGLDVGGEPQKTMWFSSVLLEDS